jgi:serine/threonine-protein phosphatase 2A regulatory subunit A
MLRQDITTITSNPNPNSKDEVLLIIAEKLGEICNCIGGDEFLDRLLIPLELLAAVEESAVRDMTLKSIGTVVTRMSEEHVAKCFIPFIFRLSSKDWFTSRISAASLFHMAYKRLPDSEKSSIRALFLTLCSDDTPSVRRAAAFNFSLLVKLIQPSEVLEEFMGTFNSISIDEQDSVRIQVCFDINSFVPLYCFMFFLSYAYVV